MLINDKGIKVNPYISLKPKWWDKSLKGKGIILKPNQGSAAKGIIHFKYNLKSKILSQEFFFTNKKEKISSCIYSAISNPIDLFKIYKEQYNNKTTIQDNNRTTVQDSNKTTVQDSNKIKKN